MKVAVTGATGFVGQHVVRALANRPGIEVVAASRNAPAHALWPANIPHVAIDVSKPSQSDFATLGRPDVLLHLAWSGLPNYKSLSHFEVHLGDQYRFLSGLLRAGLPALVCTGTCLEYGMRTGALDETMTPDPQNAYGHAKDALRRELELLRSTLPFKFTWARLFYMYGSGQPATSLYPQLVAAAGRGEVTFPMSPGDQLRDYLPVEMVARYLVDLACTASDSGIVNVCSGRPISVRALAEGWIREHAWTMALALGSYPYPDYEPMAFWGTNSRLSSLIDPASAASPS